VTIDVLTVASMKMAVFRFVAQCSLIKFTDVSEALAASIVSTMPYQALRLFIRMIKSRTMRCEDHVACIEVMRNQYKIAIKNSLVYC
jgi:hypothetical protein